MTKSNACAANSAPSLPEQEEAVHALTRGIVNKIAHGPISGAAEECRLIPTGHRFRERASGKYSGWESR